jgi:hypothetical protein
VKINGQQVGEFIIDTGAMCSALDRETAEKLGLMDGRHRLRDLKTSRLRRPDGLYHIDSLEIGGNGNLRRASACAITSSPSSICRPSAAATARTSRGCWARTFGR